MTKLLCNARIDLFLILALQSLHISTRVGPTVAGSNHVNCCAASRCWLQETRRALRVLCIWRLGSYIARRGQRFTRRAITSLDHPSISTASTSHPPPSRRLCSTTSSSVSSRIHSALGLGATYIRVPFRCILASNQHSSRQHADQEGDTLNSLDTQHKSIVQSRIF